VQDLFAAQLAIREGDPEATFSAIAEEASSWAWRGSGPPPDLASERVGTREAPNGYTMEWESLGSSTDSERVAAITLRHPDPETPGRMWRSVVDVCLRDSAVTVTTRVSREATELFVAPAPAAIRRPSLIPTLLRGFPCTAGALPVSVVPTTVHVDGVRDLISIVLSGAERVLPAVVLAPAGGRTRLAADPTRLANELAGLAHVVVLGGYLAWERFRDVVGPNNGVPYGGARLYWPGYGRPGDNLRHPFWTGRRFSDDTIELHRVLGSTLARISVHAVPLDPLPRELQRRALESQRRHAAENDDLGELVELLEADNAELLREVEEQRSQLLDLREQVATLERDLDAQRESWATVAAHVGTDVSSAAEVDDQADTTFSPETWSAFAEHLDLLLSPAFVLTDRAKEMCDPSPYPYPARMWSRLERLAEAAEAWAAADCSVGKRLDEWIQENYHIDVALHDSDLAQSSAFVFEDAEYSREPHVKVDDYVDPASCGRIYFAYDSDGKRFIVDHIGLHL
jgi:hypothetical protein